MAKKSMTLDVLEPCFMPVDDMPQIGTRRFCAQCDKLLYDFRKMSDAEIVRTLSKHDSQPCGIFLKSQLRRELVWRQQPWHRTRLFLRTVVGTAMFFVASQVRAIAGADADSSSTSGTLRGRTILRPQPKPQKRGAHTPGKPFIQNDCLDQPLIGDSTVLNPPSVKRQPASRVIKGRLIDSDSNSHRLLSYAVVSISELELMTSCDRFGNFEIVIPDSQTNATLTLHCTCNYYTTVDLPVDSLKPNGFIAMHYNVEILNKKIEQRQLGYEEEESGFVAVPACHSWWQFWK